MCTLSALVDKVVSPISDYVVQKLLRHVGYIVLYRKSLKELDDEKKKLEKLMEKNVEKVEAAGTRGEIVEKDVVEWAETAENMKLEVEKLMDTRAINENTKCLKLSCPNLISRYRMSKQSEQRLGDLKGHIENGKFDVVSHRKPPPREVQFTSSGDFVHYESREPVLKKMIDALRTPTVKTIGVYGTGGIGKTKAVEEVAKRVTEDGTFDESVMAVVSQNVSIRKIQDSLAEQLSLKFESQTEKGRAGELWNRLNNKKDNLVVLDDLWHELDLKAIGIPLKDGNKSLKIILTTRNLDVLRKMKVDEYVQVDVLTEEESWDLFNKNVGINFASAELRSVAKSVCKECRGLPVAISAVGGALAGKDDMPNWKDALDQLRNSMWENIDGIDPKMYASLRLSYDYLRKEVKEAQSILLLCCLYPEDTNIPLNLLVYHCIARSLLDPSKNTVEKARDRVFTLVGSLKTRSLLLDGKNGDFVKMHDVVRDVIISIAKTDEQYLVKDAIGKWPNEHINDNLKSISVCLTKLKEAPDELICPRLHTLRIQSRDSSFKFPDSFFNGVRELRILELKGINILSTPSSLANLSNLKTLILVDCQLQDMSFLKGLKNNLEVLVIESSSIKALPTELEELSRLRVLLLNESYNLELIPAGVISKLTHLEELRFPDEFDFRVYNESGEVVEDASRATLSELSSLTRLTSLSVFIPNDTPVPDLRFGNLVSYRLAVGQKFNSEPYSGKKMVKLVETSYNDAFSTLLERAETVHLCRVEGLEKWKGTELLELEHFVIEDCHGLDSFSTRKSFRKLTQLEVEGCGFEFLFTSSCAKRLQQLETLSIVGCEMLGEIIGTEGEKDEIDQYDDMIQFNKLKVLILENLPKLISFGPKGENTTAEDNNQPLFSEKVALPSLEHLVVKDCSSVTMMWDEQVRPTYSFPKLENVQVRGCDKLVNVFPSNMLTLGQNLKEIRVEYCSRVEFLVSIIGVEQFIFPYLCEVDLTDLINLKSFCGNSNTSEPQHMFKPQIIFLALKRLHMTGLENITEIWDKHVVPTTSFPRLVDVSVQYCDNLVNVFPCYSWAKNLQKLYVYRCGGLQVVFSVTEEERSGPNNCSIIFPKLCSVVLKHLNKLESFCGNSTRSEPPSIFDPRARFPVLEYIKLHHLPGIETFRKQVSERKVIFPAIRNLNCDDVKLYIDGKPKMRYLDQQVSE